MTLLIETLAHGLLHVLYPLLATHTTAIMLIAGCTGIYWATTCFHAKVSVAQPQNDAPAWLRLRSASTIIWHNCSSVVWGSQPSLTLTFSGLPMSSSTSAGR